MMILCKLKAYYIKQTGISHLSTTFLEKHHLTAFVFVFAEISVQYFLPRLNQLQYVLYKKVDCTWMTVPIKLWQDYNTNYYTLNSLTLFWLAESVQWIFEIGARDVITADYTIIIWRTLKVTGYHVMFNRSVISKGNHVKFASFVLLAVSEETKEWLFRSMYNKAI